MHAMMNKTVDSAAQAVADIPDGATVLVSGFGSIAALFWEERKVRAT
jgi:acyl CoA:acetate/3-ketoacid CoA transferase